MTNPINRNPRFVITERESEEHHVEYHVSSPDDQSEVSALLQRLLERRSEREHRLMTMADALRELEVPEADYEVCGQIVSDLLAARADTEGVDYTKVPFKRAYFLMLCRTLPGDYLGSYIQRNVIAVGLDGDADLGAITKVVHLLADNISGQREKLDHYEVVIMLRRIARAIERVSVPAKLEAVA